MAGSGEKCSKCQLHQPQRQVLCYDICLQHMVSLSKLLPRMGPSLSRVMESNAYVVCTIPPSSNGDVEWFFKQALKAISEYTN